MNICSGFELTSLRFSSQINGKRNPGYPIEQRLRHRVELHERDLRGGAVFQGHVDPSHPRKRGDVQERDHHGEDGRPSQFDRGVRQGLRPPQQL